MLNIGIIGPGRVGERHANALKDMPDAQLWGVAGRTLESAKAFAYKYQPTAKVFNDLHLMLNDPNLDAVIIATPDNLHANQIIPTAIAGKSILVEKPVCTSIESGKNIQDIVENHPSRLTVGYHLRWNTGLRFVAMKARDNEFCNIHRIQLRWGVNFIDHAKWRLDPKLGRWCCLSAIGTHLIDIARWMMVPTCGEVMKITSRVEYLDNTTADTAATISMHFESGAVADIFCSLIIDEPFSLEIHASKGNVRGDNLAGPIEERRLIVNNKAFIFEETNLYVSQLNAFVSSITNNVPSEVSLDEGLKNVAHLVSIKPQKFI